MKLKGEPSVAACYFGDGASSEGDFHESCNFAGVLKAPVIFICQNNQWAISTPVSKQTAGTIADRAAGYGIAGVRVDGNDPLAMYQVTADARARALAGDGPTLIEAVTYRLGAHTTADDPTRYVDPDEEERWKVARPADPLPGLDARHRALGRRRRGGSRGVVRGGDRPSRRRGGRRSGRPTRRCCSTTCGPTIRRHSSPSAPRCSRDAAERGPSEHGRGDLLGARRRDGARRPGDRARRGRRQVRRCVPGHRRPAATLRRRAGRRHADRRGGDRRRVDRAGHGRLRAGGRAAVPRLRPAGVPPDRPPARPMALPDERALPRPGDDPRSLRRRGAGAGAALRRLRGGVRPDARAQAGRPVDRRRRQGDAAQRDPRPRSGALPRAAARLPAGARRGARRRRDGRARHGAHRPPGRRRHRRWRGARWLSSPSRPRRPPPSRASTSRSSTCDRWCRSTSPPIAESVGRTGRAVVVQEAPLTAGFASEVVAAIQEGAFLSLQAPIARVSGLGRAVSDAARRGPLRAVRRARGRRHPPHRGVSEP